MPINVDFQDKWANPITPSRRQFYVSYLSTNELVRAEEEVINKLSTELSTSQREMWTAIGNDLRRELAGRQLGLW